MSTELTEKKTKATHNELYTSLRVLEKKDEFRLYSSETVDHNDLGLTPDTLLDMYKNMLLQRRFEERASQMYGKQKIGGFLHLYIGQEAIATGTANAINIGQDSVITAYRDHGHGLALGMDPNICMAELFGKSGGSSQGKGGSMHYFSKELGLFGGHGIVGAHVPVGVGIAFAHKYKEDGGVCIVFLGDGAVGQGSFHEACNLAGIYELPVVIVVENNQYAMGTSVNRAFAETDFFRHASGYNMHGSLVNGMNVLDVYAAIRDHAEMARNNEPSLIEIRTYRYRGHSMSDPQKYRTKEEMDAKKDEDPIIQLKAHLLGNKLADSKTLDSMDDEVKEIVMESVKFADESPAPAAEDIYKDVYDYDNYPFLD